MQATTQRPPLIGMNLDALTKVVLSGGMQKFVAKQLAEWLYKKKVTRFDEMVNISKKNREWLEANYVTGREAPLSRQKSADGTVKYLFDVGSGNDIESVYIPDHDRATLCVSSQAGCKMNCYFCATGRLGFRAQLTAAQIINQVLSIPPAPKPGETPATELTNVVFMGMGEPLDNIDALLTVIEIMTAPWGMAWSPKRITVSTVGKLPQLKDLLEKTQVHVAVSLHTADPMQRDQLMPAQRAFPISSVIKMLEAYDFSHQRRLSFEYIMWRGVNDDIAHADLLIRLIRGLDCRVNLIRFHVIPGVELHPSSDERMLMFRNYLNSKGVTATIRSSDRKSSRGEDIMAACGMLAGKNKK